MNAKATMKSNMNSARAAGAALVMSLAFLLAACGGGGGGAPSVSTGADASSPASTPSTPSTQPATDTTPTLPASTRFAYTTTLFENAVAVLAIHPADGTPRVLATLKQVAGGTRFGSMAADALGRYLYINAGQPSDAVLPLQVETVDPQTGLFTATLPAGPTLAASSLAFSPFGDYAYAPDGSGGVRVFRIGSGGVLSELAGSPFKGGPSSASMQVKVHPSGKLLFLAPLDTEAFDATQPAATPFLINRSTGALTPVPRTDADPGNQLAFAGPSHVWVRKSGTAGSFSELALLALDTTTGKLSPPSPPVPSPARGDFLTFAADPTGKVLFVNSGILRAYAVDATAGTVRQVGTDMPVREFGLHADERTGRVYLGDLVLEADATTGAKVVGVSPLGDVVARGTDGPVNGVLLPGAALTDFASAMYGIDPVNNVLRMFSQDQATGTLTPLAISPRPVAGRPEALAIAPTGAWADAGQLGSFVAVASSNGAQRGVLSRFPIDQRSGGASLASTIGIAADPSAVAIGGIFWSQGQGVYVAHASAAGIDGASSSPGGGLGPLPGAPFPVAWNNVPPQQAPNSSTAQPLTFASGVADLLMPARGGAFSALPVGLSGAGGLSTLYNTRELTLVPIGSCDFRNPSPSSTLLFPDIGTVGLATVGGGRFVYAVSHDRNTVTGYPDLPDPCGLHWPVSLTPFATGAQPVAIVADPGGRYMYVANSGNGGSITAYTVNGANGFLDSIAGSPFPLGRVPARLWMDVLGNFLYVADAAGSVTVQKIDRTTGKPGTPHAAAPGQPMTIGVSALLSAR
jgi:hypothetical protein